MVDTEIVALYWARDERAIGESAQKYGSYCHAIALRILSDTQDAEESVNDTWLAAWNAMPPHRPAVLSAFLGKLTRRLSLKRWRDRHAQKRGGGAVALTLEELEELLPAPGGPESFNCIVSSPFFACQMDLSVLKCMLCPYISCKKQICLI